MPGLRGRVEIVRDLYGVPHVFAQKERDLDFTTGYLQARDRLYLLDALRHVARGRLTEYAGEAALEGDILMRTLMITSRGQPVAEAVVQRLPVQFVAKLQAFSDGVNHYLAQLREGRWELPPGYATPLFAAVTPQDIPDWTPEDSVAIGRLQELDLTTGSAQDDLRRAIWGQKLPPDLFADLARVAPSEGTLVLPDWYQFLRRVWQGVARPSKGVTAPAPAQEAKHLPGLVRAMAKLSRPSGQLFERAQLGSNNWVIGGAHTQSGYPIVANDPHLMFTAPATFYHIHLNAKLLSTEPTPMQRNVMGVVTPGLPDVILGQNESLAWGGTVAGWDVADVYLEELNREGNATQFRDEMVPIERFEQVFRLGPGTHAPTRRHTIEVVPHHGPIIDKDLDAKTAITVKWTGRMPSAELVALPKINKAHNIEDFMAAVRHFTVFAQNWNGADIEGNLGYSPFAQIPIRDSVTGACQPHLPMDGTGPCEWVGMLSPDKVPSKRQGSLGWLVTANNDIAGNLIDNDPTNDPTYLVSDRASGFRAARITQTIREWIASGKKIRVEDVVALQADTRSGLAARIVPHLLKAANAHEPLVDKLVLGPALARLQAWDFEMRSGVGASPGSKELRDSVAASIFYVYLHELLHAVFADEEARYGISASAGQLSRTLLVLLENPGALASKSRLFDDLGTPDTREDPKVLQLQALSSALMRLASPQLFGDAPMSSWRWGQIHGVVLRDVIATVGGPTSLTRGPFPRPGGNFTVDVAGVSGRGEDFNVFAGAQMRFVAELFPDGPRAQSSLPGGQSDDPDSLHFDDLLQQWLRNQSFPYLFKVEQLLPQMEHYTVWEPAP